MNNRKGEIFMYLGFNVEIADEFTNYYHEGNRVNGENQKKLSRDFTNYVFKQVDSGVLSGEEIQNDWFPSIHADVFISHSHKDEKIAIGLAGWLKSKFNLNSFIDSGLWGYSNDLLKQIDHDYCLNEDGKTFDYNKRNYSTSHIHMMLANSLLKMIDKTECIFFLNTPNSIVSPKDSIESSTQSPWIYTELIAMKVVRKKIDRKVKREFVEEIFNAQKELKINYTVDLNDLVKIDHHFFNKWENKWIHSTKENHPLDDLYTSLN